MKSTPLLILALALVALPLVPAGGASVCPDLDVPTCDDVDRLHDSTYCGWGLGAACVYDVEFDVGAPVCGDDGTGYACVVVLGTGYEAIGATCIVLTYGTDAPSEGDAAVDTCGSGRWTFGDDLAVTFRDIPAEGRDVTIEGILAIGGYNDGETGTTGSVHWFAAQSVHLPGP